MKQRFDKDVQIFFLRTNIRTKVDALTGANLIKIILSQIRLNKNKALIP